MHRGSLYPEELGIGMQRQQHSGARSGRGKQVALWRPGTGFHGETGKVILELGLGRGAENQLRDLFLELGPTQLLQIPGPQLSLTSEQPRWGKPSKEARSRKPALPTVPLHRQSPVSVAAAAVSSSAKPQGG